MSSADSNTALEIRPIPDFPGYYAREDGVILSTRVYGPHAGFAYKPLSEARELTQKAKTGGYLYVYMSANGSEYTLRVQRLILMAFKGLPPTGVEARHLNSDRTDNRICNLAWGTKRTNMRDRDNVGKTVRGEKHHRAKVTESQVIEIRQRAITGEKQRVLAATYGLTQTAIWHIIHRKSWASVTDGQHQQEGN